MLIKLFEFIKGYVVIKISGFSPERFMNLCSNHNILLWNIENHGDYYIMKISITGFFQLKNILKKTKTKVVMIEKCGLPFLLPKMLKRRFFILGLIGCIAAMIILSNYIWSIEIVGNISITDDQFTDYLEGKSITYGMKKKEIPISELEDRIRKDFEQITWTSAQIKGTKLMIHIKENEYETIDTTKKYGASDLIANKGGKIKSIITRNGVPQVKEGDIVEKGDVLIAGSIPIMNDDDTIGNYQYCNSDGDVMIEYTYQYREVLDLNYEKKLYTGREIQIPVLRVSGKEIQFNLKKIPYLTYDKVVYMKQSKLIDKFNIPLQFGMIKIRECYKQEDKYSEKEGITILNKRFIKFIEELEKKRVQIIEKNVKIESVKNRLYQYGEIVLIEQIGVVNEIKEKTEEEINGEMENATSE